MSDDGIRRLLSAPAAWLGLAAGGIVLLNIGIGIEAYRHDDGAAGADLISFSSPGIVVATIGAGLCAAGVLVALSLLVLRDAPTAEDAVRRGAAVGAVWVVVVTAGVVTLTYAATSGLTIGHEGHDAPTNVVVSPTAPAVPGQDARVTLSGAATLDGAPLETQFLGARVMRDGLSSACQGAIPPVADGVYEIPILADAEARGCGAEDAQIVLWAYAGDRYVYSQQSVPWPGDGETATFDASFVTSDPAGASLQSTSFYGEATGRDGAPLAAGSVIEAYVGGVRCGVTSIPYGDDTEGFVLIVAGPDAVNGCDAGEPLTFRIDGEPAEGSATNDLREDRRGDDDVLLLSVR